MNIEWANGDKGLGLRSTHKALDLGVGDALQEMTVEALSRE